MSTLAAPMERARSMSIGIGARADVLAFAGLAALGALLVAFTWNTWGDPTSDTGYDIVAGARLADGELPYRDFIYYYGPLAPALVALAMLVGGSGIGAAVALGIVLAAAIVVMTYLVARILTGPLGAFVAAAITVPVAFGPGNFSFVLPHSYSATLGILGALVFLLGIGRYASSRSAPWLVAAGVSAGLLTLTRPEFVAAVALAGALWLVLRLRAGRSFGRELFLLAAPALAIPLAVYGGLLAFVSPDRLIRENLYPVETLQAGGNAILTLHAPLTAESFVDLAAKLVLYAAGALALVLIARQIQADSRLRRLLVVTATLGAVLAAVASFARPETLRYGLEFVYGWIPAGAALAAAFLLWRVLRSRGPVTRELQVQLAVLVVLAVLAAKTYAAFFVHASVPQIAAYAVPFAALFLVSLHLQVLAPNATARALGALWLAFVAAAGIGLTIKDARAESESISGPGGTLAATPAQAATYGAALSWLVSNTTEDERVLVAPQLTWLYTLADRRAPLEQISLHPGALPETADELAAIARLERGGVRAVIVDRRTFPEYGHTAFGGSFDASLAGWIRKSFSRVAVFGSASPDSPRLEAWVRRGS